MNITNEVATRLKDVTKRKILAAIGAALVVIIFAWLGGTKTLGAHHFWSVKVALIGAPIGVMPTLLAPRRLRWAAIIGFTALTCTAFAATKWGQTEFANSYAENQLAGHFWYFGWIATSTFATALIATILSRPQPQ